MVVATLATVIVVALVSVVVVVEVVVVTADPLQGLAHLPRSFAVPRTKTKNVENPSALRLLQLP